MCLACNPEFANAIRARSFKSRRQFLRAAAAATTGAFVAEAVVPALADGSLNETLASGLAMTPVTVFVAKKIATMERGKPIATAVAVEGDRIVATGSLDEVKAALGARPYRIDQTFALDRPARPHRPTSSSHSRRADARCRGDRARGLGSAGQELQGGDDARGLPHAAQGRRRQREGLE